MTKEAQKLRELAAWYREFAERAGNPSIWDARLRQADVLEREADRLENPASQPDDARPAALHELTERLTALAGYAAAARRLLESGAGKSNNGLAETLDKISVQAQQASEIVLRLHGLLPADPSNPPDRSATGD